MNGDTLNLIKNGSYILINGTDYTKLSNTEYIIKKEYLSTLALGTVVLTFDFKGGNSTDLSITILYSDTIPPVVHGVSKGATYNSEKVLTDFKQPTLKLDMTKGDTNLNTITTFIPSTALTQLHDKSVKDIEIKTNLASVFLPTDIFDVSDSENISVKINKVDTATLNDRQKKVVGNAPVLEFSIDALDKGDFSVGEKNLISL